MSTNQTWKIKGQVYTHEQLMELKKMGLNPHKDKIEMKFITPGVKENQTEQKAEPDIGQLTEPPKEEQAAVNSGEGSPDAEVLGTVPVDPETEEHEFERLTKEKAWLKKDQKARYAELKEKFKK